MRAQSSNKSAARWGWVTPARAAALFLLAGVVALLGMPAEAVAHGVTAGDKGFIMESSGMLLVPFMYLGAKHMVTGVDHVLFLVGVVFFLYRPRDVVLYVTLFTLGHSTTLLLGVLGGLQVNPYWIDAVIGLSVVYKAFENMEGFEQLLHVRPDPRVAVFGFGLCHGLGLATKLQEFVLSKDGVVANIVSFNVGVEIGQALALGAILLAIATWRRRDGFQRHAFAANWLLMTAGFVLFGYQLTGYFVDARIGT